jgi:hypothetical protein
MDNQFKKKNPAMAPETNDTPVRHHVIVDEKRYALPRPTKMLGTIPFA